MPLQHGKGLGVIPERDRIKTVMTPAEISEALESGDYSAEMLMQHLIRHHNRMQLELEQERQDRKQVELDVCRALGERNDARAEVARLKATLADPAEVELSMIRGDIAIPDRVEFDAIRTPAGYNPSPTEDEIDAHLDEC
jgi:hypothetical protein